MITPRMYQVKYDASLRTVLSNFRFTLWGPAPHHSLKNRIFFWLPARWASGFSGDHQQDHQCLWLLLCYTFILSFIACILLEIKLLLLLLINTDIRGPSRCLDSNVFVYLTGFNCNLTALGRVMLMKIYITRQGISGLQWSALNTIVIHGVM